MIKAEDLPENENVYLKKDMFGYRVVQPIKNEDGTTNWINLLVGGWENFWLLMFIILVILSFLYGVKEMMADCNDMAKNPCKYFNLDCTDRYDKYDNQYGILGGGEDGDKKGEWGT